MLQAYIDDSASEKGDRHLYLAGYVHHVSQWASFSNAWSAALRTSPSVRHFKMAEANGLYGEFENWTHRQRDRKIERLTDVVVRHKPWSVQCSISRKQFDEILGPVVPYELRHPYFACFYGVIITVARMHHKMGLSLPVDFIFDEQGAMGTDAVLWYRYIKEHQPPHIKARLGGQPIFNDDNDVPPLQAADLLAWHVRRDRESGDAYQTRRIMFGPNHQGIELGEEVLRSWAAQFTKILSVPGASIMRSRKDSKIRKRELHRRLALGLGPPPLWRYLLPYYLQRMRDFIRARFTFKQRSSR